MQKIEVKSARVLKEDGKAQGEFVIEVQSEITPGEWKVHNKQVWAHSASSNFFVCQCAMKDKRSDANAKLIAAAPELLKALQFMYNVFSLFPKTESERSALTQARTVLEKVTL